MTVMLLAETTSVASEPQQKSTTGEIGDRAQMAAIEKLRLVVRSKGYAESRNRMLREANQDENQIVSEPFTASIETVLVSDEGSGSKLIDTGHLAYMGIGSDLALILGQKQVLAGLPPLPSSADFGSGVVISPQIDYVASMLLASGWDDLDASLSGRLVAAVPSDDQIMLANITSDAMYEKFKFYVGSAFDEANRSVSKALLFRKDGRWVETE
ncbi:MAG TPA: hypothetical protein PKC48_03915 [Sphingorhabdus sp.]|uniref:hypothetical protein n=1 Tax=Sphingorhabdus sp. TaxID=1902408 RepID=UPI002C97C6EA|nr:hypothetical protein [Sphingorhabdus sp.]HMT42202.1 hypothetical protein [Sphingorhabdus sp.]HMU21406.1 hypothetical protein [Sphingorhabdus sp.]